MKMCDTSYFRSLAWLDKCEKLENMNSNIRCDCNAFLIMSIDNLC